MVPMFSSSQHLRRSSFFSLWKEGTHPISELPLDIKRLLYPHSRGCYLVELEKFLQSTEQPVWAKRGESEVKLCVEQNIAQTSWSFDGTQVHAFIVQKTILFLWVDIAIPNDKSSLIKIFQMQCRTKGVDRKYIPTWKLVLRFGLEKSLDKGTYIVAFVVGSLITCYGQLLVPYLRHEGNVWDMFVDKIWERPKLSIFSITIAYLFPIGVQLQAVIVARVKAHRKSEQNTRDVRE